MPNIKKKMSQLLKQSPFELLKIVVNSSDLKGKNTIVSFDVMPRNDNFRPGKGTDKRSPEAAVPSAGMNNVYRLFVTHATPPAHRNTTDKPSEFFEVGDEIVQIGNKSEPEAMRQLTNTDNSFVPDNNANKNRYAEAAETLIAALKNDTIDVLHNDIIDEGTYGTGYAKNITFTVRRFNENPYVGKLNRRMPAPNTEADEEDGASDGDQAEVVEAEGEAEPSTEPSAEPSTEPSTEPSAEPSTEPSTEPSAEPSTEPSAEPPPPAADGGDDNCVWYLTPEAKIAERDVGLLKKYCGNPDARAANVEKEYNDHEAEVNYKNNLYNKARDALARDAAAIKIQSAMRGADTRRADSNKSGGRRSRKRLKKKRRVTKKKRKVTKKKRRRSRKTKKKQKKSRPKKRAYTRKR